MKTNISAQFAERATNWWIHSRTRSLRFRLTLWTFILFCCIQLLLGGTFYSVTSEWLEGQVDKTLVTTAEQVSATIQQDTASSSADNFNFQFQDSDKATTAILEKQHFIIQLIDQTTGHILETTSVDTLNISSLALSGKPVFETMTLTSSAIPIRIYTLPLNNQSHLAVQVGQSLEGVRQSQSQILRFLIVLLVATAVLAVGTGLFLANRILRPISAVIQTAQQITEQNLQQRLEVDATVPELNQLGQTFNAMLARVEQAFQRQMHFTADAAHELRTPLSIMQTGVDVILGQERTPAQYRAALETVREEVERLTNLAIRLLTLARIDTQKFTLNYGQMDLADLLNTVIDQLASIAEEKNLTIHRAIPAQLIMRGDEDRLIQLVLNLIENAVKYTPPGGEIRVSLFEGEGKAHLSVSDTGPGIPAEDLPFLFQRFYRVDRSRSRDQGGFGLGLSIAQEIARMHGGEITVTSTVGAGSQFTVTLPVS